MSSPSFASLRDCHGAHLRTSTHWAAMILNWNETEGEWYIDWALLLTEDSIAESSEWIHYGLMLGNAHRLIQTYESGSRWMRTRILLWREVIRFAYFFDELDERTLDECLSERVQESRNGRTTKEAMLWIGLRKLQQGRARESAEEVTKKEEEEEKEVVIRIRERTFNLSSETAIIWGEAKGRRRSTHAFSLARTSQPKRQTRRLGKQAISSTSYPRSVYLRPVVFSEASHLPSSYFTSHQTLIASSWLSPFVRNVSKCTHSIPY